MDTGLRVRRSLENFPTPCFEKPTPLGFYSVTSKYGYEPTARSLRYYKPPNNYPLDLNIGWQMAIKKSKPRLSEFIYLLRFISDNKQECIKSINSEPRIAAEFICCRDLLGLIMQTPFDRHANWCIHVTKYLDSFYLCQTKLENDTQWNGPRWPDARKKICCWGFKFEQYCLSDSPFINPSTSDAVDECKEFVCVFKRVVNDMKMLFNAKMDGIISDQPVQIDENGNNLKDLKFIELKIQKSNLNSYQQNEYKSCKLCNWWCQLFLSDVQHLYLGMRSDTGLVDRIEHHEVATLPKQGSNWTPENCTLFLTQFFNVLRDVMMTVNCPYTVYEFNFNSKAAKVTYQRFKGITQHSFLPDWYIAMLQNISEADTEISQKK